jgi:hypothetical protein
VPEAQHCCNQCGCKSFIAIVLIESYTGATVPNPGAISTIEKPEVDPNDLLKIAAILNSETFERSDTLKKLLIYLWCHRNQEFSEYAIATDALGRRADFDSKFDASVRVQIARLRQKLKDFYDREGADYPILIKIPVGSHCLDIRTRDTPQSADPPDHEEQSNKRRLWPQRLVWVLGVSCIALALFSSWLLWNQHLSTVSSEPDLTEVRKFWQTFLGQSKTLIVLPTPVFLGFQSKPQVMVRDVAVNDFAEWADSPDLMGMSQRYGAPRLVQSYTVTSDTFASITLARYLDAGGMGENVTFVDSGRTPMDALEHDNEVAFGTHFTLRPFQAALDSMTFHLAVDEVYVENSHPAPHEAALFPRLTENGTRVIEPGIIAFLPGKNPRTHLLILQSERTAALVGFLTSSSGISSLQKMWKDHGSPPYYETVVYAEVNGAEMIRTWPVAMHAYVYTHK